MTILGRVHYRRSMYQCSACHKTRYPGDEELDLEATTRSPGLRRMMARAGSQSTFKEGSEDLKVYAGIKVSAKDVERVAEGIGSEVEKWSERKRRHILRQEPSVARVKTIPVLYVSYDGTGVPMTKAELVGRKGKQPDGAIESSERFGWRIYAEAVRRGLYDVEQVVILGDAAEWIRTIQREHFPMAMQIIDLYHAREHVSDMCKNLFRYDESELVRHRIRWWTWLDDGDVERIVHEARRKLPRNRDARKKVKAEIAFLEKHKEQMRYGSYRKQGLFVGSGVIEAGCKHSSGNA